MSSSSLATWGETGLMTAEAEEARRHLISGCLLSPQRASKRWRALTTGDNNNGVKSSRIADREEMRE